MSLLDFPTVETTPAQTSISIEPLEPAGYDEWDRFVASAADGTIFHTVAWMRSVWSAFEHDPIYLLARRAGDIVAVLPMFEIKSWLGGTMLVSVPYAVYGGPLGSDGAAVDALLGEAERLADRLGARCLDLRCQRAVWPDRPTVDDYVTFRGPLPARREDVLDSLPRKARAAARQARERNGLQVSIDDSHLRTVWRLYCDNMHRLGTVNYGYPFFDSLVRSTPGQHFVSLVTSGTKPIGGLVTFIFNQTAMPYFVGTKASYAQTNVGSFIYLTAMERAVELGCRTFDFGRSRRDNVGACSFKHNQGFDPIPLEYQRYVPEGQRAPNLSPSNPRFAAARRIWPKLPRILSRSLGTRLSRHVTG